MLRLLLAIAIILLPNSLHVSVNTGIPGLNVSNLLLLLLFGALAMRQGDPLDPIPRHGYLAAPLVCFFLAVTLGFLIAVMTDPSGDTLGDVTRLKNVIFYPLFYFVYRRCGQDLRGTRQLIILVLVVALVAGVEAISQGMQFGIGKFVDTQRATGPFGDATMANRAGAFFAMFLPMFAAVAVLVERKAIRVAAVAGCVLLATAILFTYSRQSYLIALLGLLILLMRRSVPAAFLAGLLFVGSISLFPDSVIERVQETRQVDAMGVAEVDHSTASRLDIWGGAIRMWRAHPAGVGLGRFTTHIGEYSSYPGRDAHNAFVLMLAECGPLGLAAMLWLFWRLWRLARLLRQSATHNDREMRALSLGFTVAVISMVLSNIYGSAFFEGLIMASFWVLCGLLERYAGLKLQAARVHAAVPIALRAPPVRLADRFPMAARALPGARVFPDASRQ